MLLDPQHQHFMVPAWGGCTFGSGSSQLQTCISSDSTWPPAVGQGEVEKRFLGCGDILHISLMILDSCLVPEEREYFLSPVLSKVVVTFALCRGGIVTVTEQQFLIPAEPWALLILPLTGEPDKACMEEWVQPFYPPVCPSKLCRCGETHLLLLFGGEHFHWRAGSPPEAPQCVLHSYKLPMLNIYIGFRLALCVTG